MTRANASHNARESALSRVYRKLYLRGKQAELRARQERQRAKEKEGGDDDAE